MAQGKKSFLLYIDSDIIVKKLPDKEAGQLFKLLFDYVNDRNPDIENYDLSVQIAFETFRVQLKRDLRKWEEKHDERSSSGSIGNLKRWYPDLYDKYQSGEITIEESQLIIESRKKSLSDNSDRYESQTIAKIAVSVSDSVNVSDSVSVSEKEVSKETINNNTSSGDEEEVYITSKKKVLKGKRLVTFNKFWEAFDYKRGKAEAAQAWYDIPQLTDKLCEQIYESAKKESEARQKLFELGKTPKMAQGWLTSKRWEDQVFIPQEKPKKLTQINNIATDHSHF